MQIRALTVPDAYEITPKVWPDERGSFFEWYRFDRLEEVVGHPLELRQANQSVSRRGVVRGIHFADVPFGQAKYVTAVRGRAIDFVVDVRVGSKTFGQWDSVLLDDISHRAVYLAEGLGHCIAAIEDDTVISYLVSDVYRPDREHGISPLDPEIALVFPPELGEPLLSAQDRDAPGLSASVSAGRLPEWNSVRAYYEELNGGVA